MDENEAVLRSLPPPAIAVQYWGTDTYLYDEMHTGEGRPKRRPSINTLYDVFATIRDDEAEHVNTMSGCQDPAVLLQSPSIEAAVAATALATTIASVLLRTVPAEIAPQLQALLEESVSTIEGL